MASSCITQVIHNYLLCWSRHLCITIVYAIKSINYNKNRDNFRLQIPVNKTEQPTSAVEYIIISLFTNLHLRNGGKKRRLEKLPHVEQRTLFYRKMIHIIYNLNQINLIENSNASNQNQFLVNPVFHKFVFYFYYY